MVLSFQPVRVMGSPFAFRTLPLRSMWTLRMVPGSDQGRRAHLSGGDRILSCGGVGQIGRPYGRTGRYAERSRRQRPWLSTTRVLRLYQTGSSTTGADVLIRQSGTGSSAAIARV